MMRLARDGRLIDTGRARVPMEGVLEPPSSAPGPRELLTVQAQASVAVWRCRDFVESRQQLVDCDQELFVAGPAPRTLSSRPGRR